MEFYMAMPDFTGKVEVILYGGFCPLTRFPLPSSIIKEHEFTK
jgi:hypothetical protein